MCTFIVHHTMVIAINGHTHITERYYYFSTLTTKATVIITVS